jgi:uncharacterized protein (TIGR00730 family)
MVAELIAAASVDHHRDLLTDIVVTALHMGRSGADRLDLKIAASALAEMAEAFAMFRPYHQVRKVTIFGSARTQPADPNYQEAREFARLMAEAGWMVVTGAGPGIMAAGMEGAGPERSIGVNIRLPFEQEANQFIHADPKLTSMKYFFTRKLMLMKESSGFVALPGGFGTMDESFELLTLAQTGKAEPGPIVFLDAPGSDYFARLTDLIDSIVSRGLASPDDLSLFRVTHDPAEAAREILGFYSNFHSRRYVGEQMVIRMKRAPDDEQLAELNEQFKDICSEGGIERTGPLPAEVSTRDNLELERISFRFDRTHHGRLRDLIDKLNSYLA